MSDFRSVATAALFAAAGIGIGALVPGDAAAQTATGAEAGPAAGGKLVERGRYLARIAGCNDCHTPGYMAQSGKVP